MSLSVTCCPNCSSTFNISLGQLESSGGLARCGACLRVFLVGENLVEPNEETGPADSVFIGRAPEGYFSPGSFMNRPREAAALAPAFPSDTDPAGGEAGAARRAAPPNRATADREPLALPEVENPLEVLSEDGHAALEQLRPALGLRTGKNFDWAAFAGKTALALLLLMALAVQYFWRHLPVYSQLDWLRPAYAQLCARAGCELPVYSRPGSIRNDNMALGVHPDYPDAYLLTARFYNAAPFPQPFPVVVLRFGAFDARTVALREFAPSEYLHPDLLALDLMPPDSPVQIELELINPGPGAVNYEVSFRAP